MNIEEREWYEARDEEYRESIDKFLDTVAEDEEYPEPYSDSSILLIFKDKEPIQQTKGTVGEGVPFERIRRITGYLVGDINRWNDAKYAEQQDRVKHNF